ncbi:hypothetical protein [Granulicella sibirica]|uniref:hypothetical protein n=1 Tax=Granulicella sibirica TaxID=2479048 RepID=UPI001008F5C8|nr:hypothetical protein [Granulicella sibirica]
MNEVKVATSGSSTEQEHEPIFIQYVSGISGRVYDHEMVDHLADMLLIFYCGGGTALGAITGASLGLRFFLDSGSLGQGLVAILCCGFAGSIVGCLLVMVVLNFRGLMKWDGMILRRSVRLKR